MGFLTILYLSIFTLMLCWGNGLVGDPCEEMAECPGDFYWGYPGDPLNILRVISVFCSTFVATQNVPKLTFELQKRSVRRIDIATVGAMSMTIMLYFSTALAGYKAFGNIVDGDLLNSVPLNIYSSIARLGMGIKICATSPLQLSPTKNSVCNMIYGLDIYECSNYQYFGVIFFLLAIIWIVGVCIHDLSIVLTFLGATACMFTGYTFPAYCYIKLFAGQKGLCFDKVMSYIIFAASLILCPSLIYFQIYSLSQVDSFK